MTTSPRKTDADLLTLRAYLRTGTSDVHEALHAHPWFAALADGSLSPATHHALITRLFSFYRSFDPILMSAAEALRGQIGTYCYIPRAPVLQRCTGKAAPGPAVTMPLASNLAAFCGAAYVVDGAVLGGAVLSRAVPDGADGTYWAWCRSDGPAIWRDTCRLLRRVEGDVLPEDALQGALSTFSAFASWMEPAAREAAA